MSDFRHADGFFAVEAHFEDIGHPVDDAEKVLAAEGWMKVIDNGRKGGSVGANHHRLCELLGGISLLSPG